MSEIFNVYCDESCHLERDGQPIMVLGALWCSVDRVREVAIRLRDLKAAHGLARGFEMKWNKVSPAKLAYYCDALDFFFDDDGLHFRALIGDKPPRHRPSPRQHHHDDSYYALYFDLLAAILSPESRYRIYLDVKDTRSAIKIERLHAALADNVYDFSREIVERVQLVRSHEVELLQLADLLIGIVSAANRGRNTSPAKRQLIERMKRRSGYDLTRSTLFREEKVNLCHWLPQTEAIPA